LKKTFDTRDAQQPEITNGVQWNKFYFYNWEELVAPSLTGFIHIVRRNILEKETCIGRTLLEKFLIQVQVRIPIH